MKYNKGYTLVELMVGLAVSSIIAIGVMKAYVGQTVVVVKHARTTQATEDGREAFTVISRLLKQSIASSITVNQPNANSTTIDFMILAGFPIWPNTTAPFSNNAVRLSWTNEGSDANKILLATSSNMADLGTAVATPLAGDSSIKNTQIASFTLDDNADGSYSLTLVSQVGNASSSTPLTASFENLILPRN